jgi:aryl-alcohol dehydrogenase-like predicted oxidoreductase
LKAIAKPLARQAIRAVPRWRERLIVRHRHVPIDPKTIEASVIESLRMLRLEHVDVLALHEPLPGEASDPDVCEILQRILDKGYARLVGIAGSLESVVSGIRSFPSYRFAQVPDGPFLRNLDKLRNEQSAQNVVCATHSIMGVKDALVRIEAIFARRPDLLSKIRTFRGEKTPDAATLLLDYAIANNQRGPVLLSMYDTRHLFANVERASVPPDRPIKELLDKLIAGASDLG